MSRISTLVTIRDPDEADIAIRLYTGSAADPDRQLTYWRLELAGENDIDLVVGHSRARLAADLAYMRRLAEAATEVAALLQASLDRAGQEDGAGA